MHGFKWLYPGLKIKRWLALMLFGVLTISFGFTVLFNTRVLAALEGKMIRFVVRNWPGHEFIVGVVLLAVGLFFLGLGVKFAVGSLMDAVSPGPGSANLANTVYQRRSLARGPRIVVIGGGTGLSTLLRGLKLYSSNITAIVTVADDGGSSGRIRQELGILPPGDIRNTIVALSDTEPLMEGLFQYRFDWGDGLEGHSFGNLFIAAMTEITGDFETAVREFGKVLAVRGRVLPSTLEKVRLKALFVDGTEVVGESQIPKVMKAIERIQLLPARVQATREAVDALLNADIIVIGPGSLYTSIIPNLLVEPIVDCLAQTDAVKVYVTNVMTQPGETDNMSAADHVRAIYRHTNNRRVIDYVLVNSGRIPRGRLGPYQEQNAYPIIADLDSLYQLGVKPISRHLLSRSDLVRHDSKKLAEEIVNLGPHNWYRR